MTTYCHYDVIVVGGGHAGCEAALAAARIGARVLFITMNIDHIGQMSCNPAIGGIAKGHVVREIDALGGEMGANTDCTAIHFRMLNHSKGPAVWSPRAQCDKLLYQRRLKHVVEREANCFVHQAEVVAIATERDRVRGVTTQFGETFTARAVVLCSGTFLGGALHYGLRTFPGGRAGDTPAEALSRCLRDDLALAVGRLKTGTPPRVMRHTIDFTAMTEQPADLEPAFSHWRHHHRPFPSLAPEPMPRHACYLVRTTAATRDIVIANIRQAPMYNGRIDGIGTRYCPSFEDKVMRFPHHETHQIYLEPEGAFTEEYYINGISTSLPPDVQWQMLRSLPGMERAELSRYAYAIEYDFVFPHQLDNTLQVMRWPGLFLAGQINGTTGYEEAAGQGLIAGINAARHAAGQSPLVLGRHQAYIGVMIDDLITKDIVEPYRLFTSRAEYRLLLRQDNAWRRLSPIGHDLGLLPPGHYRHAREWEQQITDARTRLDTERADGRPLWQHLRGKRITIRDLDFVRALSPEAVRQLEIDAHYEGYIQQEAARVAALRKLDAWTIPADFPYDMPGLRNECRAKLERIRPQNLAQAARIDGVTPAEIALLQVHLKRHATPCPTRLPPPTALASPCRPPCRLA